MGPRTEHSLLPPESARAIYETIERQGQALREEMAHANEYQNGKLDRIIEAVDKIQAQQADGRVQSERQEGQIKLLDSNIEHIDRRVTDVKQQVDDVDADLSKLWPATVRKSPTDLHPALKANGTTQSRKRLFFINPKLVLAFWIAAVAAVGTAAGGWIVQHLTLVKIAEVLQANADAKTDADVNAKLPSAKPMPPPPAP